MSLLDDPDVTLRAGDAFIRNSLIRYQFDGDGIQTGDNIIFNGYCALLSKVDAFCQPNIQGLPLFYNIRDYVKVVFSAKRPHYGERYNDDSFSDVLILGEYVASDPEFGECVILYVNNISECSRSKISFETLMLAVYIHELYHVYFRSGDNYILDVEEPLAEFGALFSLEAMASMGVIAGSAVTEYLEFVRNKTKLPKYSFGSYIYSKHQDYPSWIMGVLLDHYRIKVQNSDLMDLSHIYTENRDKWDEAYEELCKALNYVD